VSGHTPAASIGLPVYNGEKYLADALDSIVGQSYTDFELIISDNASTDQTEEICRAYERSDPRVRYVRNPSNLGAAKNFNRVFELSSGEYFKWASYDDVLGPDFLARCVEVLDGDPSVVLCHAKTGRIDEHGDQVGVYEEYQYLRLGSARPHERFFDLIRLDHSCNIVFGVARSSAVALTSLIGPYSGSDRPFLAQMGMLGKFVELPDVLFFRRDHPETTWRTWGEKPEVVAWYDPAKEGRIIFPYWRLWFEYLRSVQRVPISRSDKLLCTVQAARLLSKKWRNNLPMWRWLLLDLERAARQMYRRATRRRGSAPAPQAVEGSARYTAGEPK
jgi:glycosyltransferase involved in cell wall biosynthesis